MTCSEFLAELDDYIDESVSVTLRADLEDIFAAASTVSSLFTPRARPSRSIAPTNSMSFRLSYVSGCTPLFWLSVKTVRASTPCPMEYPLASSAISVVLQGPTVALRVANGSLCGYRSDYSYPQSALINLRLTSIQA